MGEIRIILWEGEEAESLDAFGDGAPVRFFEVRTPVGSYRAADERALDVLLGMLGNDDPSTVLAPDAELLPGFEDDLVGDPPHLADGEPARDRRAVADGDGASL